MVLASTERAARDVLDQADEALATFAEVAGYSAGRGVLIAISAEDPLLLDDLSLLQSQMARWHAEAIGADLPPESHEELESEGAFLSRMVAYGLPRADRILGLPDSLRESAAWIFVLPTEDCVEQAVDALMELAKTEMAHDEEIGLSERAMMALTLPFINSMLRKEFLHQTQRSLLQLLVTSEADPVARAALLAACLESAGLDAEESDSQHSAADAADQGGGGGGN